MIYLCGPVSNRPDGNRGAFEAAQAHLRGQFPLEAVMSPHNVVAEGMTDVEAMRLCVMFLCTWKHLNFVVALPDWRSSDGAVVEVRLALRLGLAVYEIDGDELHRLEVRRGEGEGRVMRV